jgi:predicted DNA-binding transcriptional regulator AlpA
MKIGENRNGWLEHEVEEWMLTRPRGTALLDDDGGEP